MSCVKMSCLTVAYGFDQERHGKSEAQIKFCCSYDFDRILGAGVENIGGRYSLEDEPLFLAYRWCVL